ncbi:response regulator [Pedobacter immunditicola]|uniref:response regulator n=1 Tax=Pedobacter immunditicola TaxID=3133440 RepID=UPI0030B16771
MMFKRVLIAEDHETTSISVRKTLEDLGIPQTDYTYYCDDALMHIKKNVLSEQPYDLLITDLSFEEDHRKQKLLGGMELIAAVKAVQPNLKVLVFSAENKAAVIDTLFKELAINAYVRKARHDAKELKLAIEAISINKTFISDNLKQVVKQKNVHEFSAYDITIISLLSQGTLQKEIPAYLQKNNIKPAGLSSVEKRLNLMKEVLDFSKNEQLVAYCKDFGII